MSDPALPTIIVPARLASSRFPRKLLADAGGEPLILRTAERISQQGPEFELFFAVDGQELAQTLSSAGYQCVMTDPDLPSGTDRIAQANQKLKRHSVINVQADEPMVHRDHLLALASSLEQTGADMATLAIPFESMDDFKDPNQVKVVMDERGFALYFSRSPIPYDRDLSGKGVNGSFKHLGMYAYRSCFLQRYSTAGQGKLESLEKLEQLRALELGCGIVVGVVARETVGVDVPADLQKLKFSASDER